MNQQLNPIQKKFRGQLLQRWADNLKRQGWPADDIKKHIEKKLKDAEFLKAFNALVASNSPSEMTEHHERFSPDVLNMTMKQFLDIIESDPNEKELYSNTEKWLEKYQSQTQNISEYTPTYNIVKIPDNIKEMSVEYLLNQLQLADEDKNKNAKLRKDIEEFVRNFFTKKAAGPNH